MERQQPTLFGHPVGLYTLFFAEMWERFSFYGMKALLTLYMVKGFLKYSDGDAYAVYGAYTSLVYATPFIGGILADRVLGSRLAVIIGGLLMAAGHLIMGYEHKLAFFTALALIICGNGFFKPNISTMVGSLYPPGSAKRDAGFTMFYMGINLGAGLAPLICGYVGETFGWHYGFGLATIGMLVGLAVFVAPTLVTQMMIGASALATAAGLLMWQDSLFKLLTNGFTALVLVLAAVAAIVALARGGLPEGTGKPPRANPPVLPVLVGLALAVPIITFLLQKNEIASWILYICSAIALGYLLYEMFTGCTKIERERLIVVLILLLFVMVFWMSFEQAGSSISNFTDRNVDRISDTKVITAAEVGQTLTIKLSQEQLGRKLNGQVLTMDQLDKLATSKQDTVSWTVAQEDVGMAVEGSEIKSSMFQACNPIFILIFAPVFSMVWTWLGSKRLEPSTPVKFALGLGQLSLGFLILYYGAKTADARGMVWVGWLILSYLLQTTGELCLSPVGLSMVTKMAPARIVSTVMGAWFLATALANNLAGKLAKLTSVSHGAGAEQTIPPPVETVMVYGKVFGIIGGVALVAAVICLALAPLLSKWMHAELVPGEADAHHALEVEPAGPGIDPQ